MANSYTQIYIQYVFAPKGRQNFLKSNNKVLHKYIAGIIKNLKCKPLKINNMPDHIHIFVGQHPSVSVSEFVNKIKSNSSRWLKEHLNNPFFEWQVGYGGFSYSQSGIKNVVRYIENQQEHHKIETFREEYFNFSKKFEVNFDDKYLFEFYD